MPFGKLYALYSGAVGAKLLPVKRRGKKLCSIEAERKLPYAFGRIKLDRAYKPAAVYELFRSSVGAENDTVFIKAPLPRPAEHDCRARVP